MDTSSGAVPSIPSIRSVPSVRPLVLVVDDDDDTRTTVRLVLEDAGYPVAETATVTDAIRYLDTASEPHVVLLDFLLPPDGDATPVLRHIAQTPALAARCAVVSFLATPSRLPTTEYAEIAARLGIPTLAKPFDIDALLALIAERAASLLAGGEEVLQPHRRTNRGVRHAPRQNSKT